MGGRPYTFTAKRYTFTYTGMRMGFGREKWAVDRIGRGNEGREEGVVYGYVNENGNGGNHGRILVRLWLTGSVVADVSQSIGMRPARAMSRTKSGRTHGLFEGVRCASSCA